MLILEHFDGFEGLANVRGLHSQAVSASGKLLLHELVLLIEFVHLGDELITVFLNPSLGVVNENSLRDFAGVVRALGERDKFCRHLTFFNYLYYLAIISNNWCRPFFLLKWKCLLLLLLRS